MAAKCKTPGRKRQKRTPIDRKPIGLDEELLELASVIAEFQLDNNADGWFRLPWRSGWNAVELALDVWHGLLAMGATFEAGIVRHLTVLVAHRVVANDPYLQATDDIMALTLHSETDGRKMLIAALRCYQVLVANSSGGGEVYNDVLKKAFDGLDAVVAAAYIQEWRCLDAIGTTASLQQDANDRLRRAFTTAWTRGLYHAAYSLPQAVDFTVKPKLVKGQS